jgi:serine kinase of HPr protein (carbohydrate metabolism regulator)
MIYMLAIRQLVPGHAAEYKEIETKLLIPGYAKYGAKMIGHWSTVIGNANETVNIMAFDDMVHFQKFREAAPKDPVLQKLAADLSKITVSANVRLLEPSEWSPLK